MLVLVALGGWGERDLTPGSKEFLSILGVVLMLLGLAGIFLVIYPVIRPNITLVQSDFITPNNISTPMPKPTPTPMSPVEQFISDATTIGFDLVFMLMAIGTVVFMIIFGIKILRMNYEDLLPPFGPVFRRLPRYKNPKNPKDTRNPIDRLPKSKK